MVLTGNPLGTRSDLARISRYSRETLRRSLRRLADAGWVYDAWVQKRRVIVPSMPSGVERMLVAELERIHDGTPFAGEWLAKCLLDYLVHDTKFYDNFRPAWLVSGTGGGRLELDRWYWESGVAIEFQGQQHNRTGKDFNTTEEELKKQMDRDQTKARVCDEERIHLINLTYKDLNIDLMRDRIRGLLPLVPIHESGPLYTFLVRACRRYVNYMAKSEQ